MKLAEALILRADLQKRMNQLESRLYNNVLTQEGEKPSEDPKFLLEEYMELQGQLTDIIKRINNTNNNTKFDEEMTLAEALVERDALLARRNILANAAERASDKQDRYSRTEIKYVSTINIVDYQRQVDSLAKDYRKLDTSIQGMNWNVDLI